MSYFFVLAKRERDFEIPSTRYGASLHCLRGDVADILKMNAQVVARKLHAGDLEGYKLGKKWRVSEQQLLQYLEKHKNSAKKKDPSTKTIQNFFKEGRLVESLSEIV